MSVFAVMAAVAATVLADIRWIRVAQREHYIAGSVSRFDRRWWIEQPPNLVLRLAALVGVVLSHTFPAAAVVAAVIIGAGPLGLSLKGRTSPLVWTRRLTTLAVATGVLQGFVVLLGTRLGEAPFVAIVIAFASALFVDLALYFLAPYERSQARVFVEKAKQRLRSVGPTVVAITGSYGKTSTKQYVAHFVSGTKTVLATPASFNNRAGLSRSINEQLSPGTDVFVAEMGTYGHGEIAELCRMCPPYISVLTAIGPVHLERFGSEAAIINAKSEIFEKASVCVINIDDERLGFVADRLAADGKKVWRCSTDKLDANVRVVAAGDTTVVFVDGENIATSSSVNAPPTNVACAVAVALELGVPAEAIASRLGSLPVAEHRQEIQVNADGLIVIDDTFNANPASVRRGLQLLAKKAPGEHRRIVATPGLVELGSRQESENSQFALDAAGAATDFVVIGRTNRRALAESARQAGLNTVVVDRLPQAVAWVREHGAKGDAVLYANDLPDHYP